MEIYGIPALDAEGAHIRKSRFTETQIVAILKDQDAGVLTAQLARRRSIHPNTLRTWRARYDGMESSDIAGLKQLDEDNTRLRRIVTDLTLDVRGRPQECARKKLPGPSQRKDAVRASGRRAQRTAGLRTCWLSSSDGAIPTPSTRG
jgi:putative transposase